MRKFSLHPHSDLITLSARGYLSPHVLHWQVLQGRERSTFGPYGTARGRSYTLAGEGWQHNTVLDVAYDHIGQYGLSSLAMYALVSYHPFYSEFSKESSYLPGTPIATDRDEANRRGTVHVSRVGSSYVVKVVREFDEEEVGGKTLYSWGFSPVASTSPTVSFAEVFRDVDGRPYPLYVDHDQRLRLIYSYEVRVNLPRGEGGEAPIYVGERPVPSTHQVDSGFSTTPSGDVIYHDFLFLDALSSQQAVEGPYVSTARRGGVEYSHLAFALGRDGEVLSSRPVSVLPYSPGSRVSFTDVIEFATYEAVGEVWGFGFGLVSTGSGDRVVYRVSLSEPIVKDNLHRLRVGKLSLRWSGE